MSSVLKLRFVLWCFRLMFFLSWCTFIWYYDILEDFKTCLKVWTWVGLIYRDSESLHIFPVFPLHWLFFIFLVKSEASRLPAFAPDKEKSPKYCCVNLPDGSSSKMAVKSGFSIKEVLSGLCEKHGINIAAVDLFLVGGDKVLHIFVLAFFIIIHKKLCSLNSNTYFLILPIALHWKF